MCHTRKIVLCKEIYKENLYYRMEKIARSFFLGNSQKISFNDFPFSGNAEMEEKMFISRVLKFLVNKDNKRAILALMVRDLIGVFEELSQEGGDFQENKKENGNRNATFQQKCVKSIDEKLCDLFSIRRLQ